ncbi:hypothetical protein AMTR_s00101p00038080 [Amborella trichopoda]|uniref:BZIP domain-containing protein n=1 Tax=Amborella trichopoda TaxID=13333 RepID=W1NWE8_AMBTC|nr:hypothetical protein AMTR_s00101p00038080 [Amborella trichopoda]
MVSQGGGQTPQFQILGRQGSLYSLTLDEVQNQLGDLGKPLTSMNIDELLKNVWSAEEGQALATLGEKTMGPSSSSSGLQRQSSLTLTKNLSRKTVDEVWRDIQMGQRKGEEEKKSHRRQPTLGEMTLEDFLVKAGVVSESSDKTQRVTENSNCLEGGQGICDMASVMGMDPMGNAHNLQQQQAQWMQYQLASSHHHQQAQQAQQQSLMGIYGQNRNVGQGLGMGGSPLMDVGYPENQMGVGSPLVGTLSDTQTPGRKRVATGDVVERTVERRQKRMIKNRESAARSRARKQAYTNELENKVMRLEEENERLKKQKVGISSYFQSIF